MSFLSSTFSLWLLPVAIVILFGLGIVASAFWTRRQARNRRRAPSDWPLTPRAIINSEERKIWRWLEMAFIDYSVMVKMPVTRFSTPNTKQQGIYWYELLSSLYCSFTVVRADGQVVGCIDLPSRSGISKSQRMKASLLEKCKIPYVVLQAGVQPTVAQIRIVFLGESQAMPRDIRQAEAMNTASSSLRDSISRNRQTRQAHTQSARPSKTGPAESANSDFSGIPSSGLSAFWQDDSFIMPLDSRSSPLKVSAH